MCTVHNPILSSWAPLSPAGTPRKVFDLTPPRLGLAQGVRSCRWAARRAGYSARPSSAAPGAHTALDGHENQETIGNTPLCPPHVRPARQPEYRLPRLPALPGLGAGPGPALRARADQIAPRRGKAGQGWSPRAPPGEEGGLRCSCQAHQPGPVSSQDERTFQRSERIQACALAERVSEREGRGAG